MTNVIGFCPQCRGLRNMRETQTTREMDRDIIISYHCETCGLFVEDGSFRPASWDALINSLDKFSADFIAERRKGRLV